MTAFASSHFATEGSIPTFGCTPSYERPGEGNFEEACLHPCHLPLGYQVLKGQEINASIVRRRKNIAMDVSFAMKLE